MNTQEYISEIREEECKRYCHTVPNAACNTCRAGAAIMALSASEPSACAFDSSSFSPQTAVWQITTEECHDLCGKENIPNESCKNCRWHAAILALQAIIQEKTCRYVGEDMLDRPLRINDPVIFRDGHERLEGIIQSTTPKEMLIIQALSGTYRRKAASVVKAD